MIRIFVNEDKKQLLLDFQYETREDKIEIDLPEGWSYTATGSLIGPAIVVVPKRV